MLVVGEAGRGLGPQVVGDSADRQVHLGKAEGGRFGFLPVHIDRLGVAALRLNQLGALDEHAA